MRKQTVFVCDDDPGIVDVVKIVLEDAGYTVVASRDSEKVVTTVKRLIPDLILIDLWMPSLGGEQLVPILKKDKDCMQIPVIVISASKDTQEVAARVGADGYLCKPFDIDDLEQIVKKHLLLSARQ
ncbi:response regulator [Candidatus Microgenomates bacterium]|nr:response regulator [Candidatus Microgenomates bacterium]